MWISRKDWLSQQAEQRSIRARLNDVQERMRTMQKTIDDLLAQGKDTLDKVTANATVTDSVLTLLQGENQTIKDLRDQLAAAGTDPAKLEQLGSLMDQIASANDADMQKKAAAVTANTPAT